MLHTIRSKIDILVQILIAFLAISISSLFEDKIVYAAISAIIVIVILIFYDICKYWIAGRLLFGEIGWLFSIEKRFWIGNLVEKEAAASKTSTIFVITDTLYLDARDQEIIRTVKKNTERGVHYIIVAPQSQEDSGEFAAMQMMYCNNNRISICFVDTELISRRVFDNLMVIADSESGAVEAFLQLPVGQEQWWIKMDEGHSLQAFKNVISIIKHDSFDCLHGENPRSKYRNTFFR